MTRLTFLLFAAGWITFASAQPPRATAAEIYDPLRVSDQSVAAPVDLSVDDRAREREIPIRVYLPAATKESKEAPVVLFSHGLGGSREMSSYLGKHWAARGYVAVFLQHPGSDVSVWRGKPLGERMAALKDAAGGQNYLLRVKDVPAVLDQLDKWNGEKGHSLHGRLDLKHVGMSGHSFGAVTTQAVSGQSLPRGAQPFTDPRIKAALPMSPSAPSRIGDPKALFGNVTIPWMLMTGTNDTSPINDTTVESRLAVYPALPPGRKYELVLDGGEHSAFTERGLPGDARKRNPNHHRVILALSTAFWDSYLLEREDARAWLDGDGPRTVMEKADKWQHK
jgi:predicted dienelactone hydrolase